VTLTEVKQAIATYLRRTLTSLTVSGQDVGLLAMNEVRMQAELLNDFGFMRKFATVSVDGVTGGSLSTAIEFNTTNSVDVKSIVDVGLLDVNTNFRPVDWTTVEDSLNIQRQDNPITPRYPTDAQALSGPWGAQRFVFSGDKIMVFPNAPNTVFVLGLIVYAFTSDWAIGDLASSNLWTTKGAQYLQWKSIIHLNHQSKEFVFRQEGNLPPPQVLADEGLANLITWDTFKYEQFRRHSR
jgi:hypothetical protein